MPTSRHSLPVTDFNVHQISTSYVSALMIVQGGKT
ncbi:hypothetical protein F441_00692 [Phytophthora nicotianae CJ01A1]|uniref:Uncharacterized protein n=1 Tax=Phytophthora nicotianae CJ01A1 TaxID=1317063 RepID=W2XXQ4_PHYNI|nr:hypothetical protein F441_00692 [Phytophthora nicotianae CJ01A1]